MKVKSTIKHITILGSTGSIGTQALEVVAANPDKYQVDALTANFNSRLLIEQALKFHPKAVLIGQEDLRKEVEEALKNEDIKVLSGKDALSDMVQIPSTELVITALVGFSGLRPTISAIKAGKNIALANKETLVIAGDMITKLAKEHNIEIYPVDSEHSAIFQCLTGEDNNSIEKLILTASGGPFRGKNKEYLKTVTKHQALKHPNWDMGAKVTIDSASLMNKGLEVIEAHWLFGLPTDKIEVIVHPQSIIHSIVQFVDGSMKAQMGLPDMRVPIQYAMSYPERHSSDFPRFDFSQFSSLDFEKPDIMTFKNLSLAFEALKKGGNMPCILNAANEIAVAEFLRDRIGFLEMSEIIERCMGDMHYIASPYYEDYINTDKETRIKAQELIK